MVNVRVRPRALASPHLFLVVLATMLAPMSLFVAHPLVRESLSAAAPSAPRAPNFAQLPLSFIPNVGQYDSHIRFQTNGMGGTVAFTPQELVLTLPVDAPGAVASSPRNASDAEARQATAVHMQFVGANAAPAMTSGAQLPGVVNFMRGSDQTKWQRGVPTYDGITYAQIYPGVDLRYEGAQGQLKSTYTVAPGVDPAVIRWRYAEAQSVRIDRATGNAQVGVPGTTTPIVERAPVAWQDIGGERVQVDARYVVGAGNSLGFALGSYNAAFPLIIDPTLEYSTYVGGAGIDQIYGITVDGAGNAYVVGSTYSASFPAGFPQPGTYGNPSVTNRPDVLVAKLDLASNTISFVTVIGGVGTDEGRAIFYNQANNSVYIAGYTNSGDFFTLNPYLTYQGSYDAFAASLNATSGAPDYSTYIGGSSDDRAFGVSGLGNSIYVTGSTTSNYGGALIGGDDVFVTRVNKTVAGAGGLQSLNHFGSLSNDVGTSIAVNSVGDAYITGSTQNPSNPPVFPVSATPLQTNNAGGRDAFVVKLTSSTNSGAAPTAYSSTVGGPGDENVFGGGIALDATTADVVYLSGDTLSSTLAGKPVTAAGNSDAYVLKMNLAQPAATQVVYASTVGGSGVDYASSIVVDGTGNAYIAGTTNSGTLAKNLPFPATTVNPGGGQDAFVARYDTSGALSYSTLLGGSGSEFGTGIAKAIIGGRTKVYVGGYTDSNNFPVTANAAQTTQSASSDGFIARIDNAPPIIDLTGDATPGIDRTVTFTEATLAAPTAPLAIGDAAATVTDLDNTTLQSVDVRFAATATATAPTCPPDGTLESLGVTLSGGITGTYNNGTCRLTLTGPATVADFQNVLRTVTYNNTSENPNTTPRIVVFEANDGIDSNSPFAVATINVVAVNDPPVLIVPPTVFGVTEEGTTSLFGISASDVDLGAGNLQFTVSVSPTVGTLTATASGAATVTGSGTATLVITGVPADANATLGSLSFTGALDANGTIPLNITVSDQGNTPAPPQTATGRVIILLVPANDPPVAGPAPSFTVFESRPFTITVAQLGVNDDKDINPPAAPGAAPFPPASAVTVVTPPTQGNVAIDLANQRLIYTSNANPTATTDSFVVNVCDNGTPTPALCVNQTVNIVITPVNDPPVAVADAYTTNEDVALTVVAPGVLANDDDPNVPKNLPLTAVLVTGPKSGALTLNPNGSFTYIPNSAFYGTDTFTYMARSTPLSPATPFDKLDSNPVAVTITIVPQPDVPITAPDPYLTNEDVPLEVGAAQGLVANDIDPDCLTSSQPRGDPTVPPYCAAITVRSFTQPLHGTVVVNTDGSFLYTPTLNYNGPDSFLYVATDGSIDTGPTVVTIIVQSVNDQPTVDAGLATISVAEDSGAYSQPWGTNFSPGPADESAQTLTLTITSTNATLFTQQPNVTLSGTAGTLTFTPAPNANGSSTVTLTIKDSGGTANGGKDTLVLIFTIVVTPVNDPPTAVNDRLGVGFNSVTRLNVLQNDSIVPDANETLRVAAIPTPPQHGTAAIASDGLSVIFTPTNGYKGPDSFVYQVCDNGLTNGVADSKCATATVTLTIGIFKVYLPITTRRAEPDLVGSFKLSPVPTRPGENTRITVTVTNTGSLAASNFWVDLNIEPKNAPTGANTPWDENCKLNPCYGIAWFVSETIAPGQSITLTSTSDSYARDNTIWRGFFIRGTKNLYLVVDSWNRSPGGNTGDPNGAVQEFDETNNVSYQKIDLSTGSTNAADAPTPANEPQPATLAPRSLKPPQ